MHVANLIKMDDSEFERFGERYHLAKALRVFSDKMGKKLMKHMDKSGWSDEGLAHGMYEALEKALKEGDYVSVANYAMFLDALGYKPKKVS